MTWNWKSHTIIFTGYSGIGLQCILSHSLLPVSDNPKMTPKIEFLFAVDISGHDMPTWDTLTALKKPLDLPIEQSYRPIRENLLAEGGFPARSYTNTDYLTRLLNGANINRAATKSGNTTERQTGIETSPAWTNGRKHRLAKRSTTFANHK